MNLFTLFGASNDVGTLIRSLWDKTQHLPGGKKLFSASVGRFARYSGNIGACVETLQPGFARVTMRDRATVRNHLQSVHAMALANLAEITSGLAVMYSLPPGMRGILLKFDISYLKKARGKLAAESSFITPISLEQQDFVASVRILNENGDVVAEANATWRLGLSEKAKKNG